LERPEELLERGRLTVRKLIVLDEKVRDRILAKYESSKTDWGVSRYIDDRTQELDNYLGNTKTEAA
jgi:hypothetical protein